MTADYKNHSLKSLLFTFTIFAIAMAYLESAVVVYLRALYYPNGFHFPMEIIPHGIALTEIGREIATIVMLWFVARMTAGDFKQRFALFIFTFGIWDIFYYIWLKVLIDWPLGWLDWDILFLIPLPWIGPWLAPAIVSLGFIWAAYLILNHPHRFKKYILSKTSWWLEIAAAGIILTSFFYESIKVIDGGMPERFPWWLFSTGLLLGLLVFYYEFKRSDSSAANSA